MKIYTSLLVIILFSARAYSQDNNDLIIKSIEGKRLVNIDSLAFRDNLRMSLYYADSLNKQPYSGGAVIYYGAKAIDSISIKNGYQDGWKKSYRINNKELTPFYIEYLNQKELLHVSYPINPQLKNKTAFGSYYEEKGRYTIAVIYKRSGKIIVEQRLQLPTGKIKKEKYKFSNLSELELFFRKHYRIYSYCKQAGFFGV